MTARDEFIAKTKAEATQARALGAPIVVGAVVAQAALESCYGQSHLATQANNLFGIKATKRWHGPTLAMGTEEYEDGEFKKVRDVLWRVYPSWRDCFTNYGEIIAHTIWFSDCVEASRVNDARKFIHGLVNNGEPRWATDPDYEDKVWKIVQQHRLA